MAASSVLETSNILLRSVYSRETTNALSRSTLLVQSVERPGMRLVASYSRFKHSTRQASLCRMPAVSSVLAVNPSDDRDDEDDTSVDILVKDRRIPLHQVRQEDQPTASGGRQERKGIESAELGTPDTVQPKAAAVGRPDVGNSALFNPRTEIHELPTDKPTVGETVFTDTPSEGEATTRATVPVIDLTSNSEKEKAMRRSADLTASAHFGLALGALLFMDSCRPRIAQRALASYFLTRPFILSTAITAVMGYICVPLLTKIKASQILRKEGPTAHLSKSGTPTMGGLFFVPVGLAVGALFNRAAAVEVYGVAIFTLVYAGIGLLDDGLALHRKHNYGLPGRVKLMLQVVAGVLFFLWLKSANVSSSYIIKHIVPFPAPLGHIHLGNWYMVLTAFCCAAMSNGVNLTDGLDGLAGGTVATAFIGMAVAVLPSNPGLGVFGSSMAGACFGFLVHNRYKAKVFMGDTGSLALGGALAATAASSGMFFPLLIASGVFVVETLSVMGQVFYFQLTKRMYGKGRRWLRMAPFHHHLEFLGFSETKITLLAYGVGIILSAVAAYTGLLIS